MPTTLEGAYDTVSAKFETDWNANAAGFYTGASAPPIRWDGQEKGPIPKGYFCRFSMQMVLGRQRTFRNGEDQRFVSAGVLYIQIFAPRDGDQLAKGRLRKLAAIGQKIFRGKTFDGCILFRNVRVVDLEPEESYHRANVVMEFEFDEID